MKACVLEDVGRLVYREVDTPPVKKGEVLLKIMACGICSSDLDRVFVNGTYSFPTIPGHEIAGEIVSLGNGVDKSYLNKKAVVFPLLPCFSCTNCAEGKYQLCDRYSYFGSRCDGGFAEYLSVPVWNLVLVPDHLDFSVAALCEPGAVAIHAIQKACVKENDSVLVLGSGTIGLLCALVLKATGIEVAVACRNEAKESFINGLGIKTVRNLSAGDTDNRHNVIIECVGSEHAVNAAIELSAKSGRVAFVGNPYGDITLSRSTYWKILRNELSVVGSWNSDYNDSNNNWREFISLLGQNAKPFEELITHEFSLSEHEKAFAVMKARNEFSVKVLFRPK